MKQNVFLPGGNDLRLLHAVLDEIDRADHIIILSAFIGAATHNLLIRRLEAAVAEGKDVQILTSVMNSFNSPDVISSLQNSISKLRIYGRPDKEEPFHVKAWLFQTGKADAGSRPQGNTLIIGSSNFTEAGMLRNVEWNVLLRNSESLFSEAMATFLRYWDMESFVPDSSFYSNYRRKYQDLKKRRSEVAVDSGFETYGFQRQNLPRPNRFQIPALERLDAFRKEGINRALIIAATGTGKTFLASFDVLRSGKRRILFLAHREQILRHAQDTLQQVIPDIESLIVGGSHSWKDQLPDFLGSSPDEKLAVFAMVQTLNREEHLYTFSRDWFDYIVVDEFHHAEAETYSRILNYFQPGFLLGLTATPERSDGRDVARICNHNIAFEIRLFDAVEQSLLSPFHYYAIKDEADYSQLTWTGNGYKSEDLEELLSKDTRAKLVARNLDRFLPPEGQKRKALAFCANSGHARFMTRAFQEMRRHAALVLGETPELDRRQIIAALQDEDDPLEVIFSVDVFSEGVDIPGLTHILLLRPTESFTLFLQQIGRGLRLYPGKQFVSILDFIGNYRNSFIPYLALRGVTSVAGGIDPDSIAEKPDLPSLCFVDEDKDVAKLQRDEILRIFAPKVSRRELLTRLYNTKKAELDDSPTLTDFLLDPEMSDPKDFSRVFGGNWLRVKAFMGDLTPFEKELLGGPGELVLQHIEEELRPNKSYKMAVLSILATWTANSEGWMVERIAEEFLSFYLSNHHYLPDYTALAKCHTPEKFPLSKVKRHLLAMPLHFLADKTDKLFLLDKESGRFHLKNRGEFAGLHTIWNDGRFKLLLKDRIDYALKRYFFLNDSRVRGARP